VTQAPAKSCGVDSVQKVTLARPFFWKSRQGNGFATAMRYLSVSENKTALQKCKAARAKGNFMVK
jgi:hypothetical protein